MSPSMVFFMFVHPLVMVACNYFLCKKYKEEYRVIMSFWIYCLYVLMGGGIIAIATFIGIESPEIYGDVIGQLVGLLLTVLADIAIERHQYHSQRNKSHETANNNLKKIMGIKYHQREREIFKMTEREKLDLLKKEYYASMPKEEAETKKKTEEFYFNYRQTCLAMLTVMLENYEKALNEKFRQKQALKDEIELESLLRR